MNHWCFTQLHKVSRESHLPPLTDPWHFHFNWDLREPSFIGQPASILCASERVLVRWSSTVILLCKERLLPLINPTLGKERLRSPLLGLALSGLLSSRRSYGKIYTNVWR